MNINNDYSSHALYLPSITSEDANQKTSIPVERPQTPPETSSKEPEKSPITTENIADALKAAQEKESSKVDYLMVYKIAPNSKVISVEYELSDKPSIKI